MGRVERGIYRGLNVAVRSLLRSPMHGLVSGRVMLLTITGRKSGRRIPVPLSYVQDGRDVCCFTSGGWGSWWKNLRGGAPVTARVRGRDLTGSASATTEGVAVVEGLGRFLDAFPASARRYGVGLGADGRPKPEHVDAAVRDGRAVMVMVRVQAEGL